MKGVLFFSMVLFYLAAGSWHFIHPQFYIKIMPPWLPQPLQLVYISGACEIVLALLLIPRLTRTTAAWGIIVLLFAVFPANIQMMLNYYRADDPFLWAAILRLPLQLVLIRWAWEYTK
jgi:uncharacterized membrane protein